MNYKQTLKEVVVAYFPILVMPTEDFLCFTHSLGILPQNPFQFIGPLH